jgi:hypothetical protein
VRPLVRPRPPAPIQRVLGQLDLGQPDLGQLDPGQLDLGQLDLGQRVARQRAAQRRVACQRERQVQLVPREAARARLASCPALAAPEQPRLAQVETRASRAAAGVPAEQVAVKRAEALVEPVPRSLLPTC